MKAGEVVEALAAELKDASLIECTRDGRSLIYRAVFEVMCAFRSS